MTIRDRLRRLQLQINSLQQASYDVEDLSEAPAAELEDHAKEVAEMIKTTVDSASSTLKEVIGAIG